MTASRSSRSLLFLGAAAALGCASGAPAPQSALEPLPSAGAYMPDDTDLALRDLGRGLLANDGAGVDRAVARVQAQDAARAEQGEPPSGALPYALDARNNAITDPGLYRAVSAMLLERGDLSPELRARLTAEVEDDPLRLAEARLRDARTLRFGRAFNALSEAAGRSFSNMILLGYRVAAALVQIAVAEHTSDELSLPERQALRLWKQFVEEHPEAPETPAVIARIDEAQARWYHTQRDHTVHAAEQAFERGDARLGLALAERAVRYAPEHDESRALLDRGERETSAERERLTRSEGAAPRSGEAAPRERALAVALLAAPRGEGAAVEAAAAPLVAAGGPEADEARYALATLVGERGERGVMWDELGDLAGGDSAMARHAQALIGSPQQNPYSFWKQAQRAELGDRVRYVLLGPLADGPRDRPHLSRGVEWVLALPSLLPLVTGLPQRLVQVFFQPEGRRSPAVFAARYLEQEPDGEHADDARGWLVGYHQRHGNAVGALAVAKSAPHPDAGAIERLRIDAGQQALDYARKESDLPTRVALLRRVGREYEGTPAAYAAVDELRSTVREATPQHIRISRGFLQENPEVLGPQGLALRPELLDGKTGNGELHPEGIALLGGNAIEVSYLGESGDPRDPPVRRRERVSGERIQRAVAVLEEASLRNSRVDPDSPVEYDADRDLFFERARLGLGDDPSAEARSSYSFIGIRERYGLVRKRESILPVELVLQGSLQDMSLGAFPRIRMPKPTADAFLFE